MAVEWDPAKAAANLKKHRVAFADAATALHDDYALTIPDDAHAEPRFVTLGTDATGKLLVVAYTFRGENVRLISARSATKAEARQYATSRKR